MRTLGDLRREMGKVYRASRGGRISTKDLGRFIYALRMMGAMIEIENLEERIQRLEEQTNGTS